ncbi:MAG: hypothetical protein A2289_14490 [Deltaproteobacteria bacterium RIFOXYA12_FULL_58_15]|nr:MAG: hypothetical protein A2289_14490 [Deltaproteobacteria bacterium RIFOXYA12_FULL_58_15]OGR12368.1 MAG: hypothetical protein A2341_20580 [Deltaproteobacteria bacterium RIFOXYB12_FULL_58_9]
MTGSTTQAAEVRGTFSTLLAAREDPQNEEAVASIPLYELVAMEVDALEIPGMDRSRVVLQGFGRLQLGDDELTEHSADLGLFYLDAETGPMKLKLGRQHLPYGVGRMALIDGIDGRVDLGAGFSAKGFFGFTVHPELRHRTDNWQGGGRLAFNLATLGHLGEVGAAYLLRRQKGADRRHELGVDAFTVLGPTNWVALAVLNPAEQALVEARLSGTYRASAAWSVTVDAERVSPELFLPLNSIFSVFADASHDAFGAEIHFAPSPYYTVDLAGHAMLLAEEYLGYRATLRGVTYREPSHRSLIGAELRLLDEDNNGYLRGRLFTGLQLFQPFRVSADIFVYRFAEDINGEELSLLAQASVVYDITSSMRVAGTITGGTTPWAEAQVEGMLRFAYGWDVDLAREVGP